MNGKLANESHKKCKHNSYLRKAQYDFHVSDLTHDNNDWLLALVLDEVRKSKKVSDPLSLDKAAQKIVQTTVDHYAELILKFVESHLEDMVSKIRTDARRFEERLLQRWKKPIDLLEVFVEMCCEAGAKLNEEYRNTPARSNDYVFDVLTRLHARGCQVSHEILALLKAGLPEGAHARWRTLHEIAVIAFFIKEQGSEVAKRYLHHEIVETYKEALVYQEHCRRLGYEPLSEKELEVIKKRSEEVLKTYGEDFRQDFGWVPSSILRAPNFKEMERHVKLDHLRPYYRMASQNVHSGPKGISVKLGLLRSGSHKPMLPAGRSNYGLADPGQGAAISLNQITTCLLSIRTTFERTSMMKAMQKLVLQINPAFVEVQVQIEKEEGLRNGHPE